MRVIVRCTLQTCQAQLPSLDTVQGSPSSLRDSQGAPTPPALLIKSKGRQPCALQHAFAALNMVHHKFVAVMVAHYKLKDSW